MKGPLRVVLDTNVLISALLFRNGRLRPLRQAWQSGALVPIVSSATTAELVRVLKYPKFDLEAWELQEALALYIPHAQTHEIDRIAERMAHVPVCRDPKDQMFLDLAQSAQARYLVSGDADLLCLDDADMQLLVFRIARPQDLLAQLQPS